jgi:hypothetical protein
MLAKQPGLCQCQWQQLPIIPFCNNPFTAVHGVYRLPGDKAVVAALTATEKFKQHQCTAWISKIFINTVYIL